MKPSKPILGIFRERRNIVEFIFKAPHYEKAYHELIDLLHQKGVYVALLMGQASYLGRGRFAKHWLPVNDGHGRFRFEERGPITVDLLYDKDHLEDNNDVLRINDNRLDQICWVKDKTYEVLGEFQPQSVVALNEQELTTALKDLPGDKAVLKTLTGSSGDGVFVGEKDEGLKTGLDFPLLVQEFIETGAGVPGITDKRHDIRVVLANGEPIIATLRTPPAGGYKSNLSYGGENRLLDVEALPVELLAMCAKIDQELTPYGAFRLYSLDCGLTPHGWRLYEANSMPGTINKGRGEQAVAYQDKLTDFLRLAALAGQHANKEKARA